MQLRKRTMMFNNIYRLTGVRQVEQMKTQDNLADPNSVIVRPTLMSICCADERYYTGTRVKNNSCQTFANGSNP